MIADISTLVGATGITPRCIISYSLRWTTLLFMVMTSPPLPLPLSALTLRFDVWIHISLLGSTYRSTLLALLLVATRMLVLSPCRDVSDVGLPSSMHTHPDTSLHADGLNARLQISLGFISLLSLVLRLRCYLLGGIDGSQHGACSVLVLAHFSAGLMKGVTVLNTSLNAAWSGTWPGELVSNRRCTTRRLTSYVSTPPPTTPLSLFLPCFFMAPTASTTSPATQLTSTFPPLALFTELYRKLPLGTLLLGPISLML